MATYAIGDLQGCYDEFCRLLEKLKFDQAHDTLWLCGDLVNRGGQSLAVLRLVHSFGERAITVLGNHDLSLLAVAERDEADQAKVNAELREVLFAAARTLLLDWLRARPHRVSRKRLAGLAEAGPVPVVRCTGAIAARHPCRQRTLVDARTLPGHGRVCDRRRLRVGRRADCAAPRRRRAADDRAEVDATAAAREVC